ncbi:MAG: hypothetical protein ABIL05_01390, partial [candidate division WOR-3 bacterium]
MKETGQKMHRRTFLKIFGFLTPIILFLGKIPFALAGKWEKGKINYWVGKSFKQNNVDLSKLSKGIIHARINGKWDDYQIQPLSDSFIEWNLTSRLKGLERIKSGAMPDLSGPHSGAVATYGGYRLDSRVTINNAIKGIGCAPRADRVESMIKRLKATIKYSMPEKIDILKSFYQDRNLFDWTKQTSLELYTQPDFETHTFLNLMENPIAS